MQTMKMCAVPIKRTKQSNIEKQQTCINMFTTGNIHLKYRKHPVHSAAHKLKIRSSRLVLTTAGTDLDSTDRAAIGGAKNSSASEPLKRPILSLWNSRERSNDNKGCFSKCIVHPDQKKNVSGYHPKLTSV